MDALVSLFELGGLLQGVKYGGISAEMVGEFVVTYFVDIFLASWLLTCDWSPNELVIFFKKLTKI